MENLEMGPNKGSVAMDSGDIKYREVELDFAEKDKCKQVLLGPHWLEIWKTTYVPLWDRIKGAWHGLGRPQIQGGKNWILLKKINAYMLFLDSHWLKLENHFCPSMGPNGGSVAMECKQGCESRRQTISSSSRPRFHEI